MTDKKSLIAPYIKEIFKGVRPGWKKIMLDGELKTAVRTCFNLLDERLRTQGITKELIDKNGLNTYIRPNYDKIFECFKYCDPNNVKVWIIGQDPYPNPKDAMGLSFSIPVSKSALPKSLLNIYKCLINTGQITDMPDTGDLTNWARQGVILLNRFLTRSPNIRKNEKGEIWVEGNGDSEKENLHLFWGDFTSKLINFYTSKYLDTMINHENHYCAFLLWGAEARKLSVSIYREPARAVVDVLEWCHPANRIADSDPESFINCTHFAQINAKLNKLNLTPINWDPKIPCTINMLDQFYYVKPDEKPVEVKDSVAPVVVFVDGGCPENGKSDSRASCGIYFPAQFLNQPTAFNKTIKISYLLCKREYVMRDYVLQTTDKEIEATNGRAELLSAIIALLYIIKSYETTKTKHPVILIQDATYSIMFMSCRVWKYLKTDPDLKKLNANTDLCVILKDVLLKLAEIVPIQNVDYRDYTSIHHALIHPDLRGEDRLNKNADLTLPWPGLTILHQKSHLKEKQKTELKKIGGLVMEKYLGNEMADTLCNEIIAEKNITEKNNIIDGNVFDSLCIKYE